MTSCVRKEVPCFALRKESGVRFEGKYFLSVVARAQGRLWVNSSGQELSVSVPCLLKAVTKDMVGGGWLLLSVHTCNAGLEKGELD